MGIIALEDPPLAVPKPLHKMASRVREGFRTSGRDPKVRGVIASLITPRPCPGRGVINETAALVQDVACQGSPGDLRSGHSLAVPTGAATVRGMNTTNARKCHCGHELDPHQMILVIETPLLAGVMVCPVQGCACWSTWGMNPNGRPSTPEQASITRRLVLDALRSNPN